MDSFGNDIDPVAGDLIYYRCGVCGIVVGDLLPPDGWEYVDGVWRCDICTVQVNGGTRNAGLRQS